MGTQSVLKEFSSFTEQSVELRTLDRQLRTYLESQGAILNAVSWCKQRNKGNIINSTNLEKLEKKRFVL